RAKRRQGTTGRGDWSAFATYPAIRAILRAAFSGRSARPTQSRCGQDRLPSRFRGQRHVVLAAQIWRCQQITSKNRWFQRWQVMATYSLQPERPQLALTFLGTEPVISSGSTRRKETAWAKSRDWQ